ncbi:MAG: efflux RND transporter periplasmic adaptor subunit [Tepidanaerobacteraceae bacterium]
MITKVFNMKYIILLLVILLIVSGCGETTPQDQEAEEKAVAVEVEYSREEDLPEYQSFPGQVSAENEIGLSAKMGGKVEAVLVKEGDAVKTGQALIRLEQKDVLSQYNQAKAAYNAALAQLKSLKEGQLPQQVAQLRSSLNQAEANYENAEENFERMKGLLEQGAISQQQFEGAKLQYEVAKEQYESAKTQLELTLEKSMPVSIEAAEANVKQAEAGLSAAQTALDNTVVTSPIDGTVGLVNAQVGQLLSPGVPVVTVGNMKTAEVQVGVTEENIGPLKVGQEAEVTVDAIPSPFKGKISTVSLFRDPMTKLYPVKIVVPNENGLLISGMFARVKLLIAFHSQVITVSEEAVIDYNGTKVVYCVEEDVAKAYQVVTGPSSMGRIVIKEGLPAGKKVITAGQHMLEDGVKIKVEEGVDAK